MDESKRKLVIKNRIIESKDKNKLTKKKTKIGESWLNQQQPSFLSYFFSILKRLVLWN